MSEKFAVNVSNPTDKGQIVSVPTNVLLNGKPIAVVGATATHPQGADAITNGVSGILINGMPIAYSGSKTALGATIMPATGVKISSASTYQGDPYSPRVKDNPAPSEVTLTSAYPLEEIYKIAEKDSEIVFIHLLMEIFGNDVPFEAYQQLYKDASDKKLKMPEIVVLKNIVFGRPAAFNSKKQEIYVSESIVRRAKEDNDVRGKLMLALVEEFGHYIDWLLRNQYASMKDTDARGDEGAHYVYRLFLLDVFETKETLFADAVIDEEAVALKFEYHELHEKINQFVKDRIDEEDKQGDYEFFGAADDGKAGHFGHETIERQGFETVFTPKVREKIYFGNWLRDFSQFVDPMVVRPMANVMAGPAQKAAKNYAAGDKTSPWHNTKDFFKDAVKSRGANIFDVNPPEVINGVPIPTDVDIPDGFWDKLFPSNYKLHFELTNLNPAKFSRHAIVSLVSTLATKHFVAENYKKAGIPAKKGERYDEYTAVMKKEFAEITPDVLGVYRPEEHIDNPMALMPKEGATADFNYSLNRLMGISDPNQGFVKDAIDAQFEIDSRHAMKKYIRTHGTEKFPFPTSWDYMIKLFKEVCEGSEKDPKTLMKFGAALHVVEDFFAHSNFCELSVIKTYEPHLFPWVEVPNFLKLDKGFWKIQPTNTAPKKAIQVNRAHANTTTNPELGKDAAGHDKFFKNVAYYPLVTGSFGMVDTMASILPKMKEALFSLEIKDPSKAKFEERTMGDILLLELLRDISRGQQSDYKQTNSKYRGINDDKYAEWYIKYLKARDYMVKERVAGVSYADALDAVTLGAFRHLIFAYIKFATSCLGYAICVILEEALRTYQNGINVMLDDMEKNKYSLGTNPTHTQVAKDRFDHHFHGLAAQLATKAVNTIGDTVKKVWAKKKTFEDLKPILESIFCHPAYSDWADKDVIAWAKANPKKIETAKDPSIVLKATLHGVEEAKEMMAFYHESYINDIIKSLVKEKDMKKAWDDLGKENAKLQQRLKKMNAQRTMPKYSHRETLTEKS